MNTISDTARENVRPVPNSLIADPNCVGGFFDRTPEHFDCFGFFHAPLKHTSFQKIKHSSFGCENIFLMDTYGKRLEAALTSLNRVDKDRAWLAGRIGISVSALSQVIIGKTKALTSENHELAVEALGCSGKWLTTGKGEMSTIANPPQIGFAQTESKQSLPSALVDASPSATVAVAEQSVFAKAIAQLYDSLPPEPQLRAEAFAAVCSLIQQFMDQPASAPSPKQTNGETQRKQSA